VSRIAGRLALRQHLHRARVEGERHARGARVGAVGHDLDAGVAGLGLALADAHLAHVEARAGILDGAPDARQDV